MRLVAFLSVGGVSDVAVENMERQEAAFRMFTLVEIVLLLLVQPGAEEH
jgi:hypothetical protein